MLTVPDVIGIVAGVVAYIAVVILACALGHSRKVRDEQEETIRILRADLAILRENDATRWRELDALKGQIQAGIRRPRYHHAIRNGVVRNSVVPIADICSACSVYPCACRRGAGLDDAASRRQHLADAFDHGQG